MKIMRSRTPLHHSLTRRSFLRGGLGAMGAMGLAASQQMSFAQGAKGSGPPRFVFIYSPCGRHDAWQTNTPGRNFRLGDTMEMFEPWKSRTVIMDGLTVAYRNPKLNAHWGGAHTLLGGREPMDYGPYPGESSNMSSGGQRTFDHLIADHIGGDTPVRNIVLGGLDNNNEQRGLDLSYYGRDMPQRAIHEADVLFSSLFGSGQSGQVPIAESGLEARLRLKQWEQEVLGLGQLQGKRLRARVGQQERLFLQQYEHNLNDAFRRVVATDPGAASSGALAASCSDVRMTDGGDGPEDRQDRSQATNERYHDTQLKTLASALACGRTRVGVAVMAGIRDQMRMEGSAGRRHHWHCNGGDAESCIKQYKLFDHYYGNRIVKFMKELDSYPEGDGTVLDNTIIVWTTELAWHPVDHDQDYHPVSLFGGLPGNALKMGQYVKTPFHEGRRTREDPRNRRLHEVYLTIGEALGMNNLGDFADPKYTQGPFRELLG